MYHFPCCICINWTWPWLSREGKEHDQYLVASCWPLQPGSGCFSSCPISAPLSCLTTAELTCGWLGSASCVPRVSSLHCATKTHLANISVCWVMSLTSSYNPWSSISWVQAWEREVWLSPLFTIVPSARPPETTASYCNGSSLYSIQHQFPIIQCEAQTFRTISQETQWAVTGAFSCEIGPPGSDQTS